MYKKMRLFSLVLGLISVLLLSACNNSVEFTINFDSNGGSEVSSIKTDGTSSITLPNDPIKDGYSFAGWYWDNSTFRDLFTVNSLLERGISGNLTVYAKWNEDDTPIGAIKVTFNSMGGSEVNPQYVQKDNTIAIPNTSKVGYTLDGWYTSLNNGQTFDEKWSFTNNKVTTDITLYAKWIINQYTITFNSNGGSSVSSITQDYDTLVIAPANPTKLGYTFSGWSQPVPIKMPAEDVTLIAEWSINQYTITFNSNGGSPVTAITQDYATTVSKPTDPSREGYTFAGWYINSSLTTAYTFTTMPAEDITLYAKWNIITYNINYELDGGFTSGNPTAYTVDTNTITLTIPTKEGYTFDGWYLESEFVTVKTQIIKGTVGNLTLYAKWILNSYTAYYNIQSDNQYLLVDNLLLPGETIIQVSLGSNHSAALTSNGRIFTWGSNYYGQLGDGTTSNRSTPTEITNRFSLATGDKIIQVSLGDYHSAALTSNGRIFTWGSNYYGQLGDGTTTNKSTPTEITSRFNLVTGDKIIQVSLGYYHSAALTSSGRLFTWGNNYNRQLGDGTRTDRSTPTEITSRFNLATGDKIIQVSLGTSHSAALTSSGRLFTWGRNNYGQLGDGTTTNKLTPTEITNRFSLATGDKIIQVSLGGYHSAALTSSGRLFTWGRNNEGQLGDGTTRNRSTPYEITSSFNLVTGDKIIQVSLGYDHSAALTSNGRLFTWGSNGRRFDWGYDQYGQLGDGTTTNRSTPTEITSRFNLVTGDKIIQVSLGEYHSVALTSNGRLFTWGYNYDGQLGDGTTVRKSTPTEITQAHYELLHSDTVIYNKSIMEYVPLRDGYTFSGWYSDINLNTPYIFGSMPAENLTLYAKWGMITYSIVYVMNEYTTNDASNPATYNVTSNISLIAPSVIEGTFIGWFTDEDYTNEIENISNMTGNITLYAKVEMNQYTMTFVTNGGTEISPITQDYGTAIHVSTTKEGYMFVAWCSDEGLTTSIDISKMPNANLTVYAKWAQYFTIDNMTYVYYGTYPQTVVDDSSLISSLNSLTSTNANGYYEFEGEEYAKVVARPYETGYKFINGSTIQSGQTYYFKVEPIKWRVLEEADGTYTLLSEYIIDKQVFYTSQDNRTIGGQTIYANNYEHSTIREWLNNAFYNKAFSTLEKGSILTTLVDNSASTTSRADNPYFSNNTMDKVYLLSYQEARSSTYGFSTSYSSSSTRTAVTTDYARAVGAYMNTSTSYGNGYWWMRSPSNYISSSAHSVTLDGFINNHSSVNHSNYGARPAIKIG